VPLPTHLAAALQLVSDEDAVEAGLVALHLQLTSLKLVAPAILSALPNYGHGMMNVGCFALDLELASSLTPGTLTLSGRPAAIGLFKQNHYKFRTGVFKSIDATYAKKMWAWWLHVVAPQCLSVSVTQGSSTTMRPGPFAAGSNWSKLRLLGNSGLFGVVVGLLLWHMHIRSSAQSNSTTHDLNAWAELVIDMEDVFNNMLATAAPVGHDSNNATPATTGKRHSCGHALNRKKAW
jgi:hypothetical protein